MVAREDLRKHGVSTDFFIPDATASPVVAIVQADPRTGDRTIFFTLKGYHVLKAADVPREAVRRCKLVLVDGYEPDAALAMLDVASEAGQRSVIDLEIVDRDTDRNKTDRLLATGTDCILPLGTARVLTGQKRPKPHGLASAVNGSPAHRHRCYFRGSWALTSEGVIHQPAMTANAVDTTGCGDAFHGGYAAAFSDGLPLPLCMEFAAWVAAPVALSLAAAPTSRPVTPFAKAISRCFRPSYARTCLEPNTELAHGYKPSVYKRSTVNRANAKSTS